ncbi:MAG: DNA-binding protein, partial [Candidatus Methanomethylophilaceae archaeon]|nr:DNA-binding protein [Candidatus Methanomethylophilaceae archaeon]
DDLPVAAAALETEDRDRWASFLTNQETDDHILTGGPLVPSRSYAVKGTVKNRARRLKGGHLLLDLDTEYGPLTCAAYEPSKGFRNAFQNLIPGDGVVVLGEIRDEPRVLNSEKLHVTFLAEDIEISNPDCPVCGRKMKSAGKGQAYRCKRCRTKASKTIETTIPRKLEAGWYEPPGSSRRHLSKPLKRMGVVPARIRQ